LQTFNINKVSNPFSFFLYFNYYQWIIRTRLLSYAI
jgi:hypothetical protein